MLHQKSLKVKESILVGSGFSVNSVESSAYITSKVRLEK